MSSSPADGVGGDALSEARGRIADLESDPLFGAAASRARTAEAERDEARAAVAVVAEGIAKAISALEHSSGSDEGIQMLKDLAGNSSLSSSRVSNLFWKLMSCALTHSSYIRI